MATADGTGYFLYAPGNGFGGLARQAANTYGQAYVPTTVSGVVSGAHNVTNTLYSAGPLPGSASSNFYYDFYFRIWVFPRVLSLTNPRRSTNIPFAIWNSYPVDDILNTAIGTNLQGVSIDVAPPSSFKAYEYRLANLQFGNASPNTVYGSLRFAFGVGSDTLQVRAVLATVLSVPPEIPVQETWDWYTDTMTSFDGTEQRIALRGPPRRTIKYDSVLLTNAEYRAQIQSLFRSLAAPILVPFFQYATDVSQVCPAGSTTLYINPAKTDLQVGDNVFLYGQQGQMTAIVLTINAASIIIDSPTTFVMNPGDIVVPTFACWVAEKTKVDMSGFVLGKLAIVADTSGPPHLSHSRANTTANLATVDGMPVIPYTALGDVNDDLGVITGGKIFDYSIGLRTLVTTWKNNRFLGTRSFLINRYQSPNDMDWWRDFTSYCQGMLKPFLLSTNRPDFTPYGVPGQGSDQLPLASSDFGSYFFNASPALRYLAIATANGVFYTKATSISTDTSTGNDIVSIYPSFPNATGWNQISSISLMIRCRLNSDTITLTHSHLNSVIDIPFQSAEQ